MEEPRSAGGTTFIPMEELGLTTCLLVAHTSWTLSAAGGPRLLLALLVVQ